MNVPLVFYFGDGNQDCPKAIGEKLPVSQKMAVKTPGFHRRKVLRVYHRSVPFAY